MGKRALGIPAVDASSLSRKSRWARLGIHVPKTSAASSTHASAGSSADGTPGEQLRAAQHHRGDAPVLRHGAKLLPKKQRPSDALSSLNEALEVYEVDKYAVSGRASRRSVESTWLEYYIKARRLKPQLAVSPFPLTSEGIAAVGSLMKLDGYRSFANYLSWAKGAHILRDHQWTPRLELELKQGSRSVARGLGVARQSGALVLSEVAKLKQRFDDLPVDLPFAPVPAVLLGSLWILREIELAWATWQDVAIDESGMVVSWFLPVSKVDPTAKANTRSWGCLCNSLQQSGCPYHIMLAHRKALLEHFEFQPDQVPSGFPLFPDATGKVVQKRCMVAAIERIVTALELPTKGQNGRRLYGGHTLRVSGARFWVGLGLEVYKVQVFARWGSDVILRYVADVPLVGITDQVLKLADRKEDKAQSSSEFKALAAHVQGALDELQVLREAQERHVQDVSSRLSVLQSHEPPMFLRNMDSRTGAMHKVLFAGLGAHWSAWRSFCGWRFGRANYEFQGSFSEADSLCEKCFPEHRAARPGADSDSCVSASDASASGSN